MTIQINLRMNDNLYNNVLEYSNEFGYENIQDFIRSAIREKVFKENSFTQRELDLITRFEKIISGDKLVGSMKDIEDLIKNKSND